MIVVLGGGLAGLSTSYHLGHNCMLYEKKKHLGGHIHSEVVNGFTWDEGPHISFTKYEYVKELFAESLDNDYLEYPVKPINYYKGNWIPHPAQSNLYAVPEPLRSECVNDFLEVRKKESDSFEPANYKEWIRFAFGNKFADNFPSAYTRKYWTTEPEMLTTDWVGERVFFPKIEQVIEGAKKPLEVNTHYIKKIRYPNKGGYMSFANALLKGIDAQLEHKVKEIDLQAKKVYFENGTLIHYTKLVNTLPLPAFIELCNPPQHILEVNKELSCSSVFIVNVMANHPTVRKENWIYVYDEDKFSTRINCTELLSPNNAPIGKTGIQVEVYFSKYNPITVSEKEITDKVCQELVEMGLLKSEAAIDNVYTKWVEWANVIFDKPRKEAQNTIFRWLEEYGLVREYDDLEPMTDWDDKFEENILLGDIVLAGRFAQWKYYWTDDCILRGKYISEQIKL